MQRAVTANYFKVLFKPGIKFEAKINLTFMGIFPIDNYQKIKYNFKQKIINIKTGLLV